MELLPGGVIAHGTGVGEVKREGAGVEVPAMPVACGDELTSAGAHVTNIVGYMSDTTGRTKDAGWEVGVRTTVAAPVPIVWQYLLGEGLGTWLGEIAALPIENGVGYATKDGVKGSMRSYTANSKIRLSWQPDVWPHDSTLQLTVKETITGTTIGIHHEKLASRDERRMMLGHWKNIAAAFDQHFA